MSRYNIHIMSFPVNEQSAATRVGAEGFHDIAVANRLVYDDTRCSTPLCRRRCENSMVGGIHELINAIRHSKLLYDDDIPHSFGVKIREHSVEVADTNAEDIP